MTHPLDGPRGKVERTNEHVQNLQLEVQTFLNLNPYGVVLNRDPQTGEEVASARVSQDPPFRLGLIVGDAVHNLRSALDHLMYQLVLANGGKPDTWTEFPVVWEAEKWNSKKYKAAGTKKQKGASIAVVDAIERLQPYKRGNKFREDPLWHIHEFDVRDKHRFINVVGCALRRQSFSLGLAPRQGEGSVKSLNFTMGGPQVISPLKDGTELSRTTIEEATNVQMDREFTFDVAFEQGGAGQGEPIIPTLTQFADYVAGVLDAFESHFPP